MKIVFYLGHALVFFYIISLLMGMNGANHILILTAVIFYSIALIQQRNYSQFIGAPTKIPKDYIQHPIDSIDMSRIEIESPYVFVIINDDKTHIKSMTLNVLEDEKSIFDDERIFGKSGSNTYPNNARIVSGIYNTPLTRTFMQMLNNPKNICMIEVFCPSVQSALPLSYTKKDDKGSCTKPLYLESTVNEDGGVIYCDISLTKGNKLDFLVLPDTKMVVKLYPYRKVEA